MHEHNGAVRFRDMTIESFVDRLSSSDPTPGGGSASAIAASLGASLVAMVAGLSQEREKYAVHAATHQQALHAGRELAARFLALADEDSAAYDAFAAAMKLARDTDEQKAARAAAIRSAARATADVPLRCVEACLELVRAAEALAGRSNRNASSDLTVASLLAAAAARGAAANVIVNLPALGDEAAAGILHERVTALLAEVEALASKTRDIAASGAEREPLPEPPELPEHGWR